MAWQSHTLSTGCWSPSASVPLPLAVVCSCLQYGVYLGLVRAVMHRAADDGTRIEIERHSPIDATELLSSNT